MKNKYFLWIIVAFICTAISTQGPESALYDGKWWLSAGRNHRAGFVDGYIACYSGNVKGKIKFVYTATYMLPD